MWPGGGRGLWRAPAGAGPRPELQPWRGAHAGAGGLGGAATRGGPVLEQFAPDGRTLWYRPIWEQFLKNGGL